MAHKIPIGNLLVEAGIISVKTLERVLLSQRGSGKRLGTILGEMGLVTEGEVIEALARQCNLGTIQHFADQRFPRELLDLIPASLASERLIFPLRRNQGMLVVAVLDPFDHATFKLLAQQTGLRIFLALATREEILAAIEKNYPKGKRRETGRRKVLLMDVSPVSLRILHAALEKEGYEVLLAREGVEGLKLAFAARPDLVICDAGMPHMDGYTFMYALKAHPETADIPVFLTSPKGSTEEEHRALKAGFSDYLGKPVMPVRLLARIRKTFAAETSLRQRVPHADPASAVSRDLPGARKSAHLREDRIHHRRSR